MPTEGLSEETLALKDDLPFRVNSDGWGDVWIETVSGRRIGDLDPRIDADELNEAFALAARAEGPAPPGGGGEGQQPFERYPKLAAWIERLANTDLAWSLGEWGDFLRELNAALTQPETPDHG